MPETWQQWCTLLGCAIVIGAALLYVWSAQRILEDDTRPRTPEQMLARAAHLRKYARTLEDRAVQLESDAHHEQRRG